MGNDESIFCYQVKFRFQKLLLLSNPATMKLTFTKIFYLVCIIVFLGSCDQKEVPVPAEQEILFEAYYINHAWGKQHNGFLIDKDGNIKTYKNPADWNFPSADKEISVDQIDIDQIHVEVDQYVLEVFHFLDEDHKSFFHSNKNRTT